MAAEDRNFPGQVLWAGQMSQDEPLQPLQHHPPVPGVLSQQCLHPPRRGMPGLLAQLPARLAVPATSSSAATYANAAKRDLACANTGAIRAHSSASSFRSQAPSPTIAEAATSCRSCFVTIT